MREVLGSGTISMLGNITYFDNPASKPYMVE